MLCRVALDAEKCSFNIYANVALPLSSALKSGQIRNQHKPASKRIAEDVGNCSSET
jgi:hypothetical protein